MDGIPLRCRGRPTQWKVHEGRGMQERLARRQVEVEQRRSGSRIACLTRDEARLRDTQEAYHILVGHSLQGLMILQDPRPRTPPA